MRSVPLPVFSFVSHFSVAVLFLSLVYVSVASISLSLSSILLPALSFAQSGWSPTLAVILIRSIMLNVILFVLFPHSELAAVASDVVRVVVVVACSTALYGWE